MKILHIQGAVIEHSGIPGWGGYRPYARLEDGRLMPMSHNEQDSFPIGTEGIAEYGTIGILSAWRFIPDKKENE